jgi:hypothetical protein
LYRGLLKISVKALITLRGRSVIAPEVPLKYGPGPQMGKPWVFTAVKADSFWLEVFLVSWKTSRRLEGWYNIGVGGRTGYGCWTEDDSCGDDGRRFVVLLLLDGAAIFSTVASICILFSRFLIRVFARTRNIDIDHPLSFPQAGSEKL